MNQRDLRAQSTGRARRSYAASQSFAQLTWLTFALFAMFGCATQSDDNTVTTGTGGNGGQTPTSTTTSVTGTSGTGGMSLCTEDCTKIPVGPCLKAVCNDGTYLGTYGTCVVVADEGATCDDGLFCTTNDKCDKTATCVGGAQNDCGMTPPECTSIACIEGTQSCTTVAMNEGDACVPVADLCQTNGVCQGGQCKGTPKDCSFSPYTECNTVTCDPADGMCKGTPNAAKNGQMCNLTGDLCQVGKTCSNGDCVGGTPKDCSAFTMGCTLGVCTSSNGACSAMPIPPGGMCPEATDQCNNGICDNNGMCNPVPVMDGTACNDNNACTGSDSCTAGACDGMPVAGCTSYYVESFETCPAGWTFTGEWQCGAPTDITPPANDGTNAMGLVLTGNYANNDAYDMNIALSPDFDLTSAVDPRLIFYIYVDTEGFSYDGTHLEIQQDAGAFQTVGGGTTCTAANLCTMIPISKPYTLTVNGAPAWGGHEGALGWQRVEVNIAAYAGHHIHVRFPFRSDGSGVYPGIYFDSFTLAEANTIPLVITTPSISDGYVAQPYASNLTRSGGTAGAVWSIVGGTNISWLSINSSTGALTGTPGAANMGPATVTVQVLEPSLPSNFDQATFTFNVGSALYVQGFEGACPNGWTLTGDWQCGVPTVVGPPAAYGGTQCLGTIMNANYNASNAWATTTATSPAISLVGTTTPSLQFQVWEDTEGSSWDGFNLKVSSDGGVTYNLLTTVTPAYTLNIGGQQCWGGHVLAWTPYTADLSAFAGQTIQLRFAFQDDTIIQYAGVYIDDIIVTD